MLMKTNRLLLAAAVTLGGAYAAKELSPEHKQAAPVTCAIDAKPAVYLMPGQPDAAQRVDMLTIGDQVDRAKFTAAIHTGQAAVDHVMKGTSYPRDIFFIPPDPTECDAPEPHPVNFNASLFTNSIAISGSDGIQVPEKYVEMVGEHETLHALTNNMLAYLEAPEHVADYDRFLRAVLLPITSEAFGIDPKQFDGLSGKELYTAISTTRENSYPTLYQRGLDPERPGTVSSLFDESSYESAGAGHPYSNERELTTSMYVTIISQAPSLIATLPTLSIDQQTTARQAIIETCRVNALYEKSIGIETTTDLDVHTQQILGRLSPQLAVSFETPPTTLPTMGRGGGTETARAN